jgi:Bacterial Ig-like domain (group 3)
MTELSVESTLSARIERVERRLFVTRLAIVFSIGLNLLLVVLTLQHFGISLFNRTVEARKIVLTDPSHHVLAVLGVDNDWDNVPSPYYPGIEFQDEAGEKKMGMFGTGLHFEEGKQMVNLGFTGLDIKQNDATVVLNGSVFSYSTDKGQFVVSRQDDGLDLTLGDGDNDFGVNTRDHQARMYVASPRGEFDITADKTGTTLQRYARGSDGAVSTIAAITPVVSPTSHDHSLTIAIASSANPSAPGQTVTFKATVQSTNGASASGTVQFSMKGEVLGTVTLDRGIASLSTAVLPIGATTITASYKGSKGGIGTSASLTQTVLHSRQE